MPLTQATWTAISPTMVLEGAAIVAAVPLSRTVTKVLVIKASSVDRSSDAPHRLC